METQLLHTLLFVSLSLLSSSVNSQTTSSSATTTAGGGTTSGMINGTDTNTTSGIFTTGQPVTPDPQPQTTRQTGTQTDSPLTAFPFNDEVAFCTCDLTSGRCDVNCCCDRDCTVADRGMFTTCDEMSQSVTDTSHCLDNSALFRHNSQYEVEDFPGCFAKTNYFEQNYLLSPVRVDDETDFSNYISRYGSYSFSTISSTSQTATTSTATNYRKGDYVSILSVGDTRGVLMTPGLQAYSGLCSDRNPAKFLEDSIATCRRIIETPLDSECVTNKYLTASGYLNTGVRIISSPTQASLDMIPLDSLIDIKPSSTNLVNTNLINSTCVNVVTEVTYTMFHKAGIIKQIQLDFTLGDFPNTTTSLSQKYTVLYQELNATNTNSFTRSGNPGYLIGEPVIAGWLTGDSITRTSDTSADYLTVLSSTADGSCDKSTRLGVTFGENTVTGCTLASSGNCFIHVPQAMSYIIDETLNSSIYIASFGNSSVSTPGDWVPLLRDAQPSQPQCSGLTMTLEMLYTKLGSLDKPQHRIVGAKLKFEAVQLNTDSGYTLSSDKFHITNIVSFTDVSQTPPQVTSQLDSRYSMLSPVDFFYPFVWATSAAHITQPAGWMLSLAVLLLCVR